MVELKFSENGGRIKDLTGQRFGRLRVIEYSGQHRGKTSWLCECDCGGMAFVYSKALIRHRQGIDKGTKSCGCIAKEMVVARCTKHGHAARGSKGNRRVSSEYTTWFNMKGRCNNPAHSQYPRYGGRGIQVCQRWQESFQNFIADMGLKPSASHSIERINNDGNYEPDNCKWATKKEQGRNNSRNRFLELNGEKRTISEWSEVTGIPVSTIAIRRKLGWTDERILTTPVRTMAFRPSGPSFGIGFNATEPKQAAKD